MGKNTNTPKIKKPFYRRGWFIFIAIVIIICIIFSIRGAIQKASNQRTTYTWPTSDLASMIPQPDSKYGKIHMENEDYLHIEVYKTSRQDYEAYIEKCKASGFTIDYQKFDDSYWAEDEMGYSLHLSYNEKEKNLDISLDAPPEENPSPETLSEQDNTDDPAELNDDEATNMNHPENETETTSPSEPETDTSNAIRPEFKEMLDEYEAFMDEYCEFMKNYTEADEADLLSMATDYTNLLSKEAEWLQKIDNLDQNEMNAAEAAYYLEVTSRVTQKLAGLLQ